MADRMTNAEKFERGLSSLKGYKATYGDCDVRQVYRAPDGYPLGVWVTVQRQKFQEGRLDPKRSKALKEIGLDFDPRATQFTAALDRLKRYKEAFGHTKVPPTYVTEDGYSLGQWLVKHLRDAKAGSLGEGRRTALEELGCDLGDNDSKDRAKFEKGLAAVLAFRERNGHLDIDGSHKEGGLFPGRWLNARRTSIRAGQAPKYQIEAFREHGIPYPTPGTMRTAEQAFSEAITRIRLFKEQFGHVRVPCDFVCEDGYKLGQWLYKCRYHWRKGNVRPDRIAILEELGIRTELPHYASDESIAHLFRSAVDRNSDESQQDATKVIALPGMVIMEARDRAFSEVVERLRGFREMFGHLHVPVAYVCKDGFKLGQCLASYRHQWRNGKLRPERIAALESLGLQPVLPPSDQRVTLRSLKEAEKDFDFNFWLDHLKAYKADFGDVNVHYTFITADGHRLGSWVQRQRRFHANGKMPERRIAALRAIGFNFDQTTRQEGSVDHFGSQRKVRLGPPRDSKVDKKAKREAVTLLSGMVSEALGKLANWADDDLLSDRVRVRKELTFIIRPLVRERIGSLNDAFPIM